MTNKDELNTETSGLSSIASEQAEENRAEDNAKLPLHPILADEEDAQDEVINTTAAEEQNLPKGDLLVDLDADNTETSSVAAVGNVSDANDVRDVAADKASKDKSDKKASAASAFSAFPLPDLREREDGGAIDFEEDEAPLAAQTTKVSDEVRSKSRAEFTTVYDIIDAMETTLSEAKKRVICCWNGKN